MTIFIILSTNIEANKIHIVIIFFMFAKYGMCYMSLPNQTYLGDSHKNSFLMYNWKTVWDVIKWTNENHTNTKSHTRNPL